jgi:hypothetical protein
MIPFVTTIEKDLAEDHFHYIQSPISGCLDIIVNQGKDPKLTLQKLPPPLMTESNLKRPFWIGQVRYCKMGDQTGREGVREREREKQPEKERERVQEKITNYSL